MGVRGRVWTRLGCRGVLCKVDEAVKGRGRGWVSRNLKLTYGAYEIAPFPCLRGNGKSEFYFVKPRASLLYFGGRKYIEIV